MTTPSRIRRSTFGRAFLHFAGTEAASGAVLVIAAAVGLVWANSPWSESYTDLWHTEIAIRVGSAALELDLHHWINDGLMALFFLVVAVEIKREVLEGELGDRRTAALPVLAAIGGMVVPASIFLAVVGTGEGSRGWGIPMATDIAFALGVMALVGRSLPGSLRLFLLTLAIVDDIGAIIVIAVFYSEGLAPTWLAVALVVTVAVYALRRAGVSATPIFVALGIALWYAVHESGVHATIAGVVMGLLAPARPSLDREILIGRFDDLVDVFSPAAAQQASRVAKRSVSEIEWLEHLLHPWTSFLIVPLFALANAGVAISGGFGDAIGSRVGVGVMLGLLVGKPVGILFFSWIATRIGIASLPTDATRSQLVGVAVLGGIGFTVSLFVTGLAYPAGQNADDSKLAVLVSSVLASVIGAVVILVARRGSAPADAHA